MTKEHRDSRGCLYKEESREHKALRMVDMIISGCTVSPYVEEVLENYILMSWKYDKDFYEDDMEELDQYTRRLMRRPKYEVTSVTSTDY